MDLGIVLLAAGQSSRLGRPKALLTYKDNTLFMITLEKALILNPKRVVCVVNEAIINEVKYVESTFNNVDCIINNKAHLGLGSSIKLGLYSLLSNSSGVDKILFMLVDQPSIPIAHYQSIIDFMSENRVVASRYENTFGIPAAFDKSWFEKIANLNDDEGAKKIIAKHLDEVKLLHCEDAALDIDTEEDYLQFLNRK